MDIKKISSDLRNKRNKSIWHDFWVLDKKQSDIAETHCISESMVKQVIKAMKRELGLTVTSGKTYIVKKRGKK